MNEVFKNQEEINELIKNFPKEYIILIDYYQSKNISIQTIKQYISKIKKYLHFLANNYLCKNLNEAFCELTIEDLASITEEGLEEYKEYLLSKSSLQNSLYVNLNYDFGPVKKLYELLNEKYPNIVPYRHPVFTTKIFRNINQQQTKTNKLLNILTDVIDDKKIKEFIKFVHNTIQQMNDKKIILKTLRNTVIFVLLNEGIKGQELLELQMKNIDRSNKKLILSRSDGILEVNVANSSWQYIEEYIHELELVLTLEPEFYIFIKNSKSPQPISKRTMQSMVSNYTEKYFNNPITVITFTHSFAFNFVKLYVGKSSEAPEKLIYLSKLMNYTDITGITPYLELLELSDRINDHSLV